MPHLVCDEFDNLVCYRDTMNAPYEDSMGSTKEELATDVRASCELATMYSTNVQFIK